MRIKPYKDWYTFIIILALIFNIVSAVMVRITHIKSLQGKYVIDYDPCLFYYQAKIIVENGRLPERDSMRYVPIGIQTNQHANLNSYAIAYFYKLIHFFNSSITLEQAAIVYPIVCFVLALIAFTLLVIRLFSREVALLSMTIFAITPVSVQPTVAGFADRDGLYLLEMLVVFYFYVWANQVNGIRKQILLTVTSGIITGILALTWPGVGIIMAIIVIYNLTKLLLGEYGKRELYLYISWYIPAIVISLVFTKVYMDFTQPYVILAIIVPTAVCVLAIIAVIMSKYDRLLNKLPLSNRIPVGFTISVFSLAVLIISIGISAGTSAIIESIRKAIEGFLYPILGDSRLTRQVDELKRMTILGWWYSYKAFFFVFITGAILAMYKLALKYRLPWIPLTLSFIVMIQMTVASSMLINPPLDGYTTLSNIIYIVPIIVFFVLTYILYLRKYKYQRIQEWSFDNLIFALIWFMIMFFCTRAAVRFNFLFAPVAIIVGSYVVIEILKVFVGSNAKQIFTFACIISVMWGCMPFIVSGYVRIEPQEPIPSEEWIKTTTWIKENTSKNAVFSTWWDHGHKMLAMTERATTMDNEQIPYQVHLQARHIFMAKNEMEALEFLFTHRVTHLLICPKDIGLIDAISEMGADENLDRQTAINYLSEDGENLRFFPDPNIKLPIQRVSLTLSPDKNLKSAIIISDGRLINLKPNIVSDIEQTYIFSGNDMRGCVIAIADRESEDKKKWRVFYLDETAKNSLIARLYIFNENSPFFVPVYPISHGDQTTRGIKIWKINYPMGIEENQDYLLTEFPNPVLYKTRR